MTKPIKPFTLATIGLSVLLISLQFLQSNIAFDRALISQGQWWRLLTANFIHFNFSHLAINLAGLWILTFLFIDHLKTKTFILSSFFLSITVGICLYLYSPDLELYYGFSGVLYGLFIIGGASAIVLREYFTGIAVMFIVLAKIIWDFFNGGSQTSADLIGIPVATDAHLFGVLGALFIAFFAYLLPYLLKIAKSGGGAI